VRRLAIVLLALGVGADPAHAAAKDEKVIDVRAVRPVTGTSFEAMWDAYRKADASGDAEGADKLFKEIRRLRTERNVRSLEDVALALVARGLERLANADRSGAEEDFTRAVGLDPHLPDAYLGLARAEVGKGPLGILAAVKDTASAMTARLDTSRGKYFLILLVIPVALLALFATVSILGLSLLLRNGTLLLHDLQEKFGDGREPLAMGVFAVLLFLPTITFQGFGWLPLWWLALLFLYLSRVEKVVAALALLSGLLVGPAVQVLSARILAESNPLFRATMQTIEGGPDSRAREEIERGLAKLPDDRDLSYLLAIQNKKDGRYDDAAQNYREILRVSPDDRVALNNLANIEFARGEFPAAIARYKQGAESSPTPEINATFYYNLSLAHLQRFEYQPAQEARSQAERLAIGLVRSYDNLWKYDKSDYAVVDLTLSEDQAWSKFSGVAEGVGMQNVAGKSVAPFDALKLLPAAANRFAGFLGVAALVAFLLSRWRGKRMFTLRCQKCGTPFCKHCHLGAAAAGLCTQCHHLFVVRDGVSGPARNQKLLEVQKEDERRERIFRALSLLSPGAGHLYAQKPLLGTLFAMVWYGLLALVLLAGRVLPVTEAPSSLVGGWGLWLAAALLLLTYVLANRARPDFEFAMPAPHSTGRVRRS
jgi:tetratricopeptide (TPR) repeat protein